MRRYGVETRQIAVLSQYDAQCSLINHQLHQLFPDVTVSTVSSARGIHLLSCLTNLSLSVCLSVSQSVYLSLCLSVCPARGIHLLSCHTTLNLSVCLSICLSVGLSVSMSVCLSICLCV